ncbi:MAG: hypothetical protein IIY75_01030 [Erysipelotrichales bacterium]|nr:hypothetical protein [Erysipelotrichales bacterium]
MASCIYVTNREMIEYHRLNGANELNFWRPLSQTRMKKFYPGDLIFFLTKTDIPGKSKEKGIIGYGEYVRSERLSLSTMWRKYGDKNGYAALDALRSAMKEYGNRIPEKISCLYIDHVVFFNSPVFPSDIGMKIPWNLESYTYTNDGKNDYTYKLLEAGSRVGLNYWAATMTSNKAEEDWFNKDLRRNRVSVFEESIPDLELSKSVIKSGESAISAYTRENPGLKKVNEKAKIWYEDDEQGGTVWIPCLIGVRDIEKLKTLAGHLWMWAKKLTDEKAQTRVKVLVKPETAKALTERFFLPERVTLVPFDQE